MNDSVDIKTAANRLQNALENLEGSLSPLLDKVNTLQRAADDAQSFEQDRAQLAAKLDAAQSDAQDRQAALENQHSVFAAREAEFKSLAEATTQELDSVIRQVRSALSTTGER